MASSGGNPNNFPDALKLLQERFPRSNVHIDVTFNSMSAPNIEIRKHIIEKAIRIYTDRQGSIRHRLWPDDTKIWFPLRKDIPSVVPHDFTNLDTVKKMEDCKTAIKEYLKKLFLFEPPQDWFSERQFPTLFEELKHLVGMTSTAQGGLDRNLTLGNVVLLLAAATTDKAEGWIKNFVWRFPSRAKAVKVILPEQTVEQAQKAIIDLSEKIFVNFRVHDDDIDKTEGSKVPLVKGVNPTENLLQIYLGFPCTNSSEEGRDSLLHKVRLVMKPAIDGNRREIFNGRVFSGYIDFLISSAISKRGREARCVMNLYPNPDPQIPGETILEIRPCQSQ